MHVCICGHGKFGKKRYAKNQNTRLIIQFALKNTMIDDKINDANWCFHSPDKMQQNMPVY